MSDGWHWRISTTDGVVLGHDRLTAVLTDHHQRLVETWRTFTREQWDHPSRNPEWTVHQTVRHLADALDRGAGIVTVDRSQGEPRFDPRSTPDEWLAASDHDSPERTIERFSSAASTYRDRVGERWAAGDTAHESTVYGTAHWTVNVAHLLWDSWIHERDVLLPLGLPAVSSEAEERVVGLYGLLMALVPSRSTGRSVVATVQLRGLGRHTIEATNEAGSLVSAEISDDAPAICGVLTETIDALAGRGDVADALPGAPTELGMLAAFFNR
ncbi:MAG: maleylpyruvate isomerase family mycothiol-dependent enzyme [Acidimicrobiales bacterium]